jgi:hypothetical protein
VAQANAPLDPKLATTNGSNIAGGDVGSEPTLIPDTSKHAPRQAPKLMATSLPGNPRSSHRHVSYGASDFGGPPFGQRRHSIL